GVHRLDSHVKGRAGALSSGCTGLAGGRARRGGFTRHQQLQLGEGARIDRHGRTGIGALAAVGRIRSGQGLRAGGLERDAQSPGAGNQSCVCGQGRVGVTRGNVHRVGDGTNHVPEIVHGVDGDVEGGGGGARGRRAGLAAGAARRGGFAWHQQLEFPKGRRTDDNVDGSRAGQAAGGEVKRDRVGEVVGEIRKRGDAVDGRGGQGALQGPAAGTAGHGDHGAVVAGAQVAQRVFDADDGLLRKGRAGRDRARRLGQDRQLASGGRIDRDAGRGGARQGAGGEVDGDGFSLVVGKVGERGHAVDSGGAGRSLQGRSAQIARGRDHRAAVTAAQIAEGIHYANHRCWREHSVCCDGGR